MFFVKNYMSAHLGWSTESKSFYLGFNEQGATDNFGFRFYAIGNGGSGSGACGGGNKHNVDQVFILVLFHYSILQQ